MTLAESTFKKVMEGINPYYAHDEFKKHNKELYKGIMKTISECGKGPKELIDKLKAQIAVEDTDYTAIRNYARELEQRNRELVEFIKSVYVWLPTVKQQASVDLLSKHSAPCRAEGRG